MYLVLCSCMSGVENFYYQFRPLGMRVCRIWYCCWQTYNSIIFMLRLNIFEFHSVKLCCCFFFVYYHMWWLCHADCTTCFEEYYYGSKCKTRWFQCEFFFIQLVRRSCDVNYRLFNFVFTFSFNINILALIFSHFLLWILSRQLILVLT